MNLESAARKNDSDATVVPSQVKLADSTATGTSGPAFSLPLCLFPPRPHAVPSLVPPRGLVQLHGALGRETHPGESNARKRGLAGSGGPVPCAGPLHRHAPSDARTRERAMLSHEKMKAVGE